MLGVCERLKPRIVVHCNDYRLSASSSDKWTSLRNFLTIEQMFSTTTFSTWDSRRVVQRLVRLRLSVLAMTLIADKSSRITIMLFSCHCCLISNANSWYLRGFSVTVAYRLWVNGRGMSMNALSLLLCLVDLNEQSCPLKWCDPSRVCSCHFPGRPVTYIYNMENMVPQESEVVSPVPDEKFRGPLFYFYFYYYIQYFPF